MTPALLLAGFRGSFAGYEDALVWFEPLVRTPDGLRFPAVRDWTAADLRAVFANPRDAFELVDDSEHAISPGDLVVVCGRVHERRLERLGISLSDYVDAIETRDFLVAATAPSIFDRLVEDVALAAQRGVWTALAGSDVVAAASAARVLEQSPIADLRRTYAILALVAIASKDPDEVAAIAEFAEVELGVPHHAFFIDALDRWQQMQLLLASRGDRDSLQDPIQREMDKWREAVEREIKVLTKPLVPALDVATLTRPTRVMDLTNEILDVFERAARQREPVRLELDYLDSPQRVWLPALAFIAHQAADATGGVELRPYFGGQPIEQAAPNASQLLARSGIEAVISESQRRHDRTDSGTPRHTYRVLTKSRNDLVVVDLHLPVDAVFQREVLERLVPAWLWSAFGSERPLFLASAERVIAELVKNVREHAGLDRSSASSSLLQLSATRGGGQASTDRLWIVVRDNGVGVQESLRRRVQGRLEVHPEDVLPELLAGPETVERAQVRKATGAGDGLADLTTTCRELSARTGFPPELVLFSASRVETSDERGWLVACLSRADVDFPSFESFETNHGATGTLAVVMLPAGRIRPAELQHELMPAEATT